jgi:tetratricopeptide (TPR) repeat protein
VALAGAILLYWRATAHDRDRQQALEAARSGDFAAVEPVLRAAREAHPDDLEVVKSLAVGYDGANRGEEAAAEFARWSELSPDDTEPVAATFRLWERLRHFERAADAADRLLRFPAVQPGLYPHVVAVYMLAGRLRAAEDAARAGIAAAPENVRLRLQLAEALHAQGRSEAAAELLERLTREAPAFAEGWRVRGVVAGDRDDPAAAIPFLERALTLQPADLTARYALGLALRRCGREDDARRELDRFEKARRALDLADMSATSPDRIDLGLRTAAALFEAGLDRDGHEFLRRVLDRDPTNAEARRLREAHRDTTPR